MVVAERRLWPNVPPLAPSLLASVMLQLIPRLVLMAVGSLLVEL